MAKKMQKQNFIKKAAYIFTGAAMLISSPFISAKLLSDTTKTLAPAVQNSANGAQFSDTASSKDYMQKSPPNEEFSTRRRDTLYSKDYPPLIKKQGAIKGAEPGRAQNQFQKYEAMKEEIIKIDTSTSGFIQLNDSVSYNPSTGGWKNPNKK